MKQIKKKKAFLGSIVGTVGMLAQAIGGAVNAKKEDNLKRRQYEREQGQVYANEALASTAAMNQELNDRGYIDAMKSRVGFKMGGKYNDRFKSTKRKHTKKKFEGGGTYLDKNGVQIAGDVLSGAGGLIGGIADLAMSAKKPVVYNIKQGEAIQPSAPKVIKSTNDIVQQNNLAMQQVTNPQMNVNQVQNPILNQAKLGTKRVKQKNTNRFK